MCFVYSCGYSRDRRVQILIHTVHRINIINNIYQYLKHFKASILYEYVSLIYTLYTYLQTVSMHLSSYPPRYAAGIPCLLINSGFPRRVLALLEHVPDAEAKLPEEATYFMAAGVKMS